MTRHDDSRPTGTNLTRLAGGAPAGVFAAAGLIAVVTLAARIFGFGRWLVFSQSVGATCVGTVYQNANLLPNVVFEVAAGGALAAVVVPVIAGQLARPNRAASEGMAESARTASAMLTWTLAVLVPLSVLMAVFARPLSSMLVDDESCAGATDLMASMLLVFSPQIALYGIGIVLAGVLQAHRRFLGVVVAPLLSSLVVIGAYLLFAALAQGRVDDLGRLPGQASMVLAAGTTLGVAALSLPLLVPVHRAGIRLRPTWTFPEGVARRAGVLAGAGLSALVAQQAAVLVTLWVSEHRGGTGTLNVYVYVQAIYLLPYAVLAVPFAMSALPTMATGLDQAELATDKGAGPAAGSSLSAGSSLPSGSSQPSGSPGDRSSLSLAQSTLAASARAIIVTTSVGAAVLLAVASPAGVFFGALDAGRDSAAGQEALGALPVALTAFAPGLVGFGMAALLTRALYVQGRPAVAGALVALGWLIAAAVPLLVLPGDAGPRRTLLTLGLASSFGMTVAAAGLFLAVRRSWGPRVFRGFGRSAAAAGVAGALSATLGRSLAEVLHPDGLVSGAVTAALVATVVAMLCAVLIWVADRESASLALARLPGLRRRRTR
jgi:putative peptidoglycan lipid II flippase